MKKILFAVTFLVVFLALNARAQIMNGVYNRIVEPMDIVENKTVAFYADAPIAGGKEDAKNQERRYEEATTPMDRAANRSVYMFVDDDKNTGKRVGLEDIDKN